MAPTLFHFMFIFSNLFTFKSYVCFISICMYRLFMGVLPEVNIFVFRISKVGLNSTSSRMYSIYGTSH